MPTILWHLAALRNWRRVRESACRWRIPNREQPGRANELNELARPIQRRMVSQDTRARPGLMDLRFLGVALADCVIASPP